MSLLGRRRLFGRRSRRDTGVYRVTSARRGLSDDIRHRQVRYAWMMGIRTACLVLAVVVPNTVLRVLMLVGAVVLPYFAVVLANGGREPDETTPSLIEDEPRKPLPKASEKTDSGAT